MCVNIVDICVQECVSMHMQSPEENSGTPALSPFAYSLEAGFLTAPRTRLSARRP